MVEQSAQENDESKKVEDLKLKDEVSRDFVNAFQMLLDKDPDNAIQNMRDNIDKAVEEGRVTSKFQTSLNEILEDVEKEAPEKRAQTFKEAVENNEDLKGELEKVLLLREKAENKASPLSDLGGPFAILFAVLSLVSGGNADVKEAMDKIAEKLNVDLKPIKEAFAAKKEEAPKEPEQKAEAAQSEPQQERPSREEAVALGRTQEPGASSGKEVVARRDEPQESSPREELDKGYTKGVNGGPYTTETKVEEFGVPGILFFSHTSETSAPPPFGGENTLSDVFKENHSPPPERIELVDAKVDHGASPDIRKPEDRSPVKVENGRVEAEVAKVGNTTISVFGGFNPLGLFR
ncbi:MAG: hypothetical protein OEY94_00245 [Alphaproteobacteria bacterium]|nr:hypothetical protein [Alphaproteobacteria bacterium]